MKRIIFWGILLSPAFLVLFFIAVFFADVIRINRVSHDDIGRSFDRFLAAREGSTFPPPKAFHEMEPGGANVFLFGASSAVISDKLTFGDYLEKDLGADNRKIKVINFGIPGIDSHSVKSRVEQSLRFSPAPPRAIILYFGHNDYNVAYTSSLNTHWDNSFNTFLKIGYRLSGRKFNFPDQKFVFKAEEYDEYLWYAIFTRPVFFNIAQRLRLYRVDNAKYGEYNARILEQFKNNTEEILRMARLENIPVIIVTPIGNLHARPYGDIGMVDRNYRLGTRAKGYMESVEYLIRARDNEIFTGDTRAKSALLDYLRTLDDGASVFVCDLETDLIKSNFRFDGSNFLDYFHLNDRAHRTVSKYLSEKIRSNPILKKTLALD